MPRRVLDGVVVSAKMAGTIVVEVKRKYMHPLYKKFITTSKKYHVHAESGAVKVGEAVSIIETRPISKTVCWELKK